MVKLNAVVENKSDQTVFEFILKGTNPPVRHVAFINTGTQLVLLAVSFFFLSKIL